MILEYIIIVSILVTMTIITYAYLYNYFLTVSMTFDKSPVDDAKATERDNIDEKDTINILVVDGGGIRGLIPLYVIKHLEKQLGQPIDKFFDVFSGVSTGAVIVTALNVPSSHILKSHGVINSKADLLIDLYKSESDYLFSTPWYHKLLTGCGLFSPKYLGHRLHSVMEKHFSRELNFTDLKKYVIIPSLNMHTGELHLFKNRGEDVNELPTNSLYQLVTAAVSGVTLFPPVDFMAQGKGERSGYFVDAGISANNPASIALLDIIREYPDKNYYVLILGSGTPPLESSRTSYKKLKNWGKLRWASDAIKSVQRSMDSQQLNTLEIAKLVGGDVKVTYNYLNVEVSDPHIGLFEYKEINDLQIHSDRLIKKNEDAIKQVIDHLCTAQA
ncbi:hypothetical protein BTJ40_14755 [Microbulbifer sp. A4B17]|uniref:patatin-like phospholipase family protein n=1 Tax=Microbulbifer sp. A4B17 TaxID=359370 RepID=UPI000D52D1E7|nr:patatin-like phospholipase family protein [Microbulbifer sp. A4B17]AWF81984.1 hypothetical protein BTJ40_14755 [Microbulbifer sp. A4B17]